MKLKSHQKTLQLTELSVLFALVIVLQIWGSGIRIGPTSITLVLIPIVLGSILFGIRAGAALGLLFGAVTLISGMMGIDPFTAILFQNAPIATVLICLGKATAAGAASGLVYRLLSGKHPHLATLLSAMVAPTVNTGLFIAGTLLLAKGAVEVYISTMALGVDAVYFVVILCAGWNFVAEFIVNLVAAPALERLVKILHQKFAN